MYWFSLWIIPDRAIFSFFWNFSKHHEFISWAFPPFPKSSHYLLPTYHVLSWPCPPLKVSHYNYIVHEIIWTNRDCFQFKKRQENANIVLKLLILCFVFRYSFYEPFELRNIFVTSICLSYSITEVSLRFNLRVCSLRIRWQLSA